MYEFLDIPNIYVGRYVVGMPTKPTGSHREKRLTAATVRSYSEPGFYGDGHGLYLKVVSKDSKRWVQRIVIHGKRRDIGLGNASLVSLAEAREMALQHRKAARAGEDPLASKKRSTGLMRFDEVARRYHASAAPTWRNEKHSKQWISTLEKHAFPVFGSKRIDQVDAADVGNALDPIWTAQPETAKRVKQRIGLVLKFAMSRGWRADNPAAVASLGLAKHDRSKVKHRLALPYDQVGAAVRTIRGSQAGIITKLAFEFLILTATRSGETLKATWSEIDEGKRLWTISADRMKAKKEHRIPLTRRCMAILRVAKALKSEDSDLVFPGTKAGKPLSDMTLSKLTKELGIAAVPHGFRSSFRDWAGEVTHHAREVLEAALAHAIKDKAEAAYARSDLFDKRRSLMYDWSVYLKDQR